MVRLASGAGLVCLLCGTLVLCGGEAGPSGGSVVDATGAAIPGARVCLVSAQGAVLRETTTDQTGQFIFDRVAPGSYAIRVEAPSFAPHLAPVRFDEVHSTTRIQLDVARLSSGVTVMAGGRRPGAYVPQVVSVAERDDLVDTPLRTVAGALEGGAGILVQETTPGQSSPILRGLTGYQTLLLLDNVRLNTSIFRSGPNQYLGYVEPSQADAVEVVLGPASSIYGSDSLGGTVQVRTRPLQFADGNSWAIHGDVGLFGASGDLSGRTDGTVMVSRRSFAALVGGAFHLHNDARPGGATDSHNVFRRYFGLDADATRALLGSRLQDTGFRRRGRLLKAGFRPSTDQSVTMAWTHGSLSNVRSYREMLGGLGRLQALYEPQSLDLFYGQWEKSGVGPLESVSVAVSLNSQRDDSVRQGPAFADAIVRDANRVKAWGFSVQSAAAPAAGALVTLGSDIHLENVASSRIEENPVSRLAAEKRGQYPDDSRSRSYAAFGQGQWELLRDNIVAGGGLRWTLAELRTNGAGLGDFRESYQDLTWNANLRWNVTRALTAHAIAARGFRAPNLSDIGSLGLTGLGFEMPARAAVLAGARIGLDASEGALPSAAPASSLKPETLMNYEVGARVQAGRVYLRAQVFHARLRDPIVRRTMLFPAGAVPAAVAGVGVQAIPPTPAQAAAGVAPVATDFDPRAVKAYVNAGRQRYSGVETQARWAPAPRWALEAAYSFLTGEELDPERPARRLPPQQGRLALRYAPAGSRLWIEISILAAGAQDLLNPGDLDDERIGASRRRADVAAFFRSAIVAPYLTPGGDGLRGTADDGFAPTGETLAAIQSRVLPIGAVLAGVPVTNDQSRVPLYTSTPGFFAVSVTGGFPLAEGWSAIAGVSNLLDRNYRVHGSGVDAMGASAFCGIRFRF